MFDPIEAKLEPNFYQSLKNDVEQECSRFGEVISVKVFERNPEGVVAIKFANSLSASRCIEVMNGRYFATRKLLAEYFDGYTNYFTAETEDDKNLREEQWEKWLAGNDDYEPGQEQKENDKEDNKEEDNKEEDNKENNDD